MSIDKKEIIKKTALETLKEKWWEPHNLYVTEWFPFCWEVDKRKNIKDKFGFDYKETYCKDCLIPHIVCDNDCEDAFSLEGIIHEIIGHDYELRVHHLPEDLVRLMQYIYSELALYGELKPKTITFIKKVMKEYAVDDVKEEYAIRSRMREANFRMQLDMCYCCSNGEYIDDDPEYKFCTEFKRKVPNHNVCDLK